MACSEIPENVHKPHIRRSEKIWRMDMEWTTHWQNKVNTTHVHRAIRHCEEDPVKVQEYINNSIPHYENNYSKCHPTSRCKMDPDCELLRIVLTSNHAEKLVDKTIKYPQGYVLGIDTFYVESFNKFISEHFSRQEHFIWRWPVQISF